MLRIAVNAFQIDFYLPFTIYCAPCKAYLNAQTVSIATKSVGYMTLTSLNIAFLLFLQVEMQRIHQKVDEAMSSQTVQTAVEMGFELSQIRRVVQR